jgi:hypothetical protein
MIGYGLGCVRPINAQKEWGAVKGEMKIQMGSLETELAFFFLSFQAYLGQVGNQICRPMVNVAVF